jgi:hypothetical protein
MTSWRDGLKIHPAADLFPPMGDDELRTLGEDIVKNGLTSPIVLWKENTVSPPVLLDGRSRFDAMEIVGLQVEVNFSGSKGDPQSRAYVSLSYRCAGGERKPIIPQIIVGGDPYGFADSANLHRRHLSPEQREKAFTEAIARNPEKSDRQFAKELGVDHKTIGRVRARGEDVGSIPHVETRTDTKGRAQPARKPSSRAMRHRRTKLGDDVVDKLLETPLGRADELDALIMLNRGAPKGELTKPVQQLFDAATAGEAVSAITYTKSGGALRREDVNLGNAGKADAIAATPVPVAPHDDLGPTSTGELERLQARWTNCKPRTGGSKSRSPGSRARSKRQRRRGPIISARCNSSISSSVDSNATASTQLRSCKKSGSRSSNRARRSISPPCL